MAPIHGFFARLDEVKFDPKHRKFFGPVTILAWVDPGDGTIRYVSREGPGVSHYAGNGGPRLTAWLTRLRRYGVTPKRVPLARAQQEDQEAVEQYWIDFFTFLRGNDLYNLTGDDEPERHEPRHAHLKERKIVYAPHEQMPGEGTAAFKRRRCAHREGHIGQHLPGKAQPTRPTAKQVAREKRRRVARNSGGSSRKYWDKALLRPLPKPPAPGREAMIAAHLEQAGAEKRDKAREAWLGNRKDCEDKPREHDL